MTILAEEEGQLQRRDPEALNIVPRRSLSGLGQILHLL